MYNGKENEQLVLFVNEHCWLFYDYYLANIKQIKERTIKWHEPFCGAKTSLCKFSMNYLKQRQSEYLKAIYEIRGK